MSPHIEHDCIDARGSPPGRADNFPGGLATTK
jgi:hypothetical protein